MIYSLKDKKPVIGKNNYIAPNATLVGDIVLGEDVSIWFGAVLRGDMSKITIGDASNIQDNCTVHGDAPYPVTLGKGVTVGHNAIVHGCTIGDNCVIGMGAILLNGVTIPKNCLVGAGSVVGATLEVAEGSLVIGNPAIVKKKLSDKYIDYLKYAKDVYINDIDIYTKELEEIK
ncbi:MAG: gamma carbonic anhydrase family protein [Psychrilyobacter sp.]|uniref:gamma carbonic anhydrase family protein n=1 Tax=Psychrilyobacter sp. TaxID=2586924 RepID=UPI003C7629AF